MDASVRVFLSDQRGKRCEQEVVIRVPEDVQAGEVLRLRVLNARVLDLERAGMTDVGVGGFVVASVRQSQSSQLQPRTVEEVFSQQNRVGRVDELAVVLSRKRQSVRQGIEVLEGLPVSVVGVLAGDRRVEFTEESVVFERRLNVRALIQGELTRELEVSDSRGWF
jgi:hypothetical protein